MFQKGRAKTGGRKKGLANHLTTDVKTSCVGTTARLNCCTRMWSGLARCGSVRFHESHRKPGDCVFQHADATEAAKQHRLVARGVLVASFDPTSRRSTRGRRAFSASSNPDGASRRNRGRPANSIERMATSSRRAQNPHPLGRIIAPRRLIDGFVRPRLALCWSMPRRTLSRSRYVA
jgi:hypothetical protein